jgi:proteasome lid subunit RPN8/RPN11
VHPVAGPRERGWLTEALAAALQAHARACYPEECVGALLEGPSGEVTARRLVNAAAERRRGFSISARDYLAVEAEAERAGATLVGFYHSHPDAPAVPSARDAEAAWAGWWTVIVPVRRDGAGAPRAWRFDPQRAAFVEAVARP